MIWREPRQGRFFKVESHPRQNNTQYLTRFVDQHYGVMCDACRPTFVLPNISCVASRFLFLDNQHTRPRFFPISYPISRASECTPIPQRRFQQPRRSRHSVADMLGSRRKNGASQTNTLLNRQKGSSSHRSRNDDSSYSDALDNDVETQDREPPRRSGLPNRGPGRSADARHQPFQPTRAG